MRAPKFNVGQLVAYFPPPGLDAPRGAYQVTAEVPLRSGISHQASVRSTRSGRSRERSQRALELRRRATPSCLPCCRPYNL